MKSPVVYEQASDCHFNIREFVKLIDKIPISTIELLPLRFQALLDILLFHELESRSSIRIKYPHEELYCISFETKNAIGGRRCNIATQERKVC